MTQAGVRRREATKAFVRYFLMGLLVVGCLSGLTTYALLDSRAQRHETLAIRIAYCTELEKLKTQNREDVADDKKHYARNLKLLGLKNTTELHDAVAEDWRKELRRNARKSCPYKA